jgi:hypothetical protein
MTFSLVVVSTLHAVVIAELIKQPGHVIFLIFILPSCTKTVCAKLFRGTPDYTESNLNSLSQSGIAFSTEDNRGPMPTAIG